MQRKKISQDLKAGDYIYFGKSHFLLVNEPTFFFVFHRDLFAVCRLASVVFSECSLEKCSETAWIRIVKENLPSHKNSI